VCGSDLPSGKDIVDYIHGPFIPRPRSPVRIHIWRVELKGKERVCVPNFDWHPSWDRLVAWDNRT
jgi:hypothetical protein